MIGAYFVVSLFIAIGAVFASAGNRIWNFDSDPPGVIAKGFTNERGEWKVVAESTAPSQPNVLAQQSKNSGSIFNLTFIAESSYQDVDLSVKMKAVAGREDQGGGLVWRAKDKDNYYVARYNPLEDNYRLYKVIKGQRSELKNANIEHTEGWHALRVTMQGTVIQCYYDGRKYIETKDGAFGGPGKIGLWTKADAQTQFDDLTVSSLNP